MEYENVKFGEKCREKLIEGVNLCANAVETTYGPNGRNSLILDSEGVLVTKDGFHTAMAVNDKDPYVTMGINLVQNTCKKTAKDVGDGTSTCAIFIRELVNHYKDKNLSLQEIRNLHKLASKTLCFIQKHKHNITCKEDLINVATIAANNDRAIGALIGEAFEKVGIEGIVSFEESGDVRDTVEYSEGFRIDSGYSSPYFINTSKNKCELENVLVYISDVKMDEVKKVISLADDAVKKKKSLLLIAPDFDSEILVFLSANLNLLKSCTVLSPGRRNFREILLKDIQALLGESKECKKVIITKDTTTFIGCDSNKEELKNRENEVRQILQEGSLPEFELDFHKKRLANFTSGIATIYVGGYSQVEVRERYDRIEDAVCATQAALKEGIVPGGGLSLLYALKELDRSKELDSACKEFITVLCLTQEILGTSKQMPKDMLKAGVIEPFLVTKTVLENAVSTAALILSANVAILNNNVF